MPPNGWWRHYHGTVPLNPCWGTWRPRDLVLKGQSNCKWAASGYRLRAKHPQMTKSSALWGFPRFLTSPTGWHSLWAPSKPLGKGFSWFQCPTGNPPHQGKCYWETKSACQALTECWVATVWNITEQRGRLWSGEYPSSGSDTPSCESNPALISEDLGCIWICRVCSVHRTLADRIWINNIMDTSVLTPNAKTPVINCCFQLQRVPTPI